MMINKKKLEDKILNPLNNIELLVISENFTEFERKNVLIEIERIVSALENEGLINKRLTSKTKNNLKNSIP